MVSNILLKDGIVICHGANDVAQGIKADLLIKDDKIAQIAPHISVFGGCNVIDCNNKVIAPGFIDTHRHMYNTALRGRHGNNLLPDYLVQGILQGGTFSGPEIFWGQLAGCLECVNNGTTTIVDHSHLNYTEDRPTTAIRATVASGIRSVYGYCFTGRVDSWSPFKLDPAYIAPFALDSLERLAKCAPFGNGRIQLGVAYDGWFLPDEIVIPLFQKIKDLGIKYITTHNGPSASGTPTSIEKMNACGVFSPELTVILAHANHLSPKDVAMVKKHGAYISSTPSVELQMGMGTPACFDPDRDVQSSSSLGVDCHNVAFASIVNEMRTALVHSRAVYNDQFLRQGKMNAKMNHTVQEAYALGTIQGARALGMESEIGSLAVGKKADILVFDALSPSMICGAQYDPVTAIVMHSTPGDIEMVFIDGILRKENGGLCPVQVDAQDLATSERRHTQLSWSEVSQELLTTQKSLQEKVAMLDLEAAKQNACISFGMDPTLIVAKL